MIEPTYIFRLQPASGAPVADDPDLSIEGM